MELKLSDLETLFAKIKNILSKYENKFNDYYENKNLSNFRYKIFLANGEKINLSIPANSVPHLLGINTNYLSSLGIFKSTNSFDIAKELCDNAYKINQMVINGRINYDNFLSKHIFEKVNGFLPNTYFSEVETEFICKYKSNKSYEIADNIHKFDYVLIKKLNDDKIGVLCIVKNENYFVPMSNRIYNNINEAHEFFNEILNNQEITLVNGFQIFNAYENNSKSHSLPLNLKLDKLDKLKYYSICFNAYINVLEDYEWALNSLTNRKEEKILNSNFIDNISKNILEGNIISTENLEDNNLIQIVEAFNDYLCNKNESNADIKYSEAIKELKLLKENIQELETNNKQLQNSLNLEINQKNELQNENNELNATKEKVLKILLDKKI